MQDNSIKDDFGLPVDKGWAQMAAQLDEAMPQRRRRMLWWWLPALFLVLGVGLYTWSLVGQGYSIDSRNEVENATNRIPVASIITESEQKTRTSTEINKESPGEQLDQTAKSSAIVPQVGEAKQAKVQGRQTVIRPSRLASTNNEVTSIQNNPKEGIVDTTIPEHLSNTGTVAEASTSTPLTNTTKITEDNQPKLVKTRALNTVVTPLANSSLSLLQNAELTAGAMPKASSVRSSPKYRFYAEALAGEALDDRFSSVLLGLGVERSLGAAWQISGGVQFQYSQSNLFSQVRSDEDILLGVGVPTGGGVGVVYDISSGFNVLKTQRLNTYTQLGYQIHPRIRLAVGLQASSFQQATAGLSSQADEFAEQNNPNLNSESRELDLYKEVVSVASFDQVTNAYSAPRSLDVRRWQWSAQSSISYRLHPAWSMELQYLRHLTAWPAKGESFGGPHSLQFGFRYYFRK